MELFKIGGQCPETNYIFMGELNSGRLPADVRRLC